MRCCGANRSNARVMASAFDDLADRVVARRKGGPATGRRRVLIVGEDDFADASGASSADASARC